MKMKPLFAALAAATFALGVTGAAHASDSKFVVKFGLAGVVPKSQIAEDTKMSSSVRPSIGFEYLVTPNIGIEVLGAWPFRHNVKQDGVKVFSVDTLSPTVSLKYHFLPENTVSPFVGLGLNYALMHNVKTSQELQEFYPGMTVDVKNSFGLAAHVGVDFNFNKNWMMTVDARWLQMRNKIYGNQAGHRTVDGKYKIDPIVLGLSVGYRF